MLPKKFINLADAKINPPYGSGGYKAMLPKKFMNLADAKIHPNRHFCLFIALPVRFQEATLPKKCRSGGYEATLPKESV